MKRVDLAVSVASADDLDIHAATIVTLSVPDHYSVGLACREALRRLEAAAGQVDDDD